MKEKKHGVGHIWTTLDYEGVRGAFSYKCFGPPELPQCN